MTSPLVPLSERRKSTVARATERGRRRVPYHESSSSPSQRGSSAAAAAAMVETLAGQVLQLTLWSQPTIIAGGGAPSRSGASMPGMERNGVRQRLIDLGVRLYKFHASSLSTYGPESGRQRLNIICTLEAGVGKARGRLFAPHSPPQPPRSFPPRSHAQEWNGMEWSRVSPPHPVEKRVRRRFVLPPPPLRPPPPPPPTPPLSIARSTVPSRCRPLSFQVAEVQARRRPIAGSLPPIHRYTRSISAVTVSGLASASVNSGKPRKLKDLGSYPSLLIEPEPDAGVFW